MSARRSPKGNGDNAFSYTCNVCARARAHARALGVEPAVASVATVANNDEWPTNPQLETVAQTVASAQTVAIAGNPLEMVESFPFSCSTQGTARGPPWGASASKRATTARSAKNRAAAALTTTTPIRRSSWL